MNPPKPLKAGTWISKDGELMETKDVRLWARQLAKRLQCEYGMSVGCQGYEIMHHITIDWCRSCDVKKELLSVAGDEKT